MMHGNGICINLIAWARCTYTSISNILLSLLDAHILLLLMCRLFWYITICLYSSYSYMIDCVLLRRPWQSQQFTCLCTKIYETFLGLFDAKYTFACSSSCSFQSASRPLPNNMFKLPWFLVGDENFFSPKCCYKMCISDFHLLLLVMRTFLSFLLF